ncbi:4Fe-4S dicluster domain-containing protein [Modestobacter sp. I12A-02628]|uniref:(Fe-S)-binding protein n=1 Tax=Goekera deserti TaxID=2497753 RepID=A0A7K3W9N3_9ACTN|nr:(Fe-S)-binding protein [Goekera deserti]MPQ98760.1 4Fe-4S dicluster domain-containing protein [Goekera deserti]NDI49743.1 4Fe-4S dicluster domain-containing protein [Goekera deserti]NEL53064.1 (Fe-S)-binding protein [Goekera deserti]
MGPLQIVLGTLCVLLLVVATAMATLAVRKMLAVIKTGQPDSSRSGPVGTRLKTLAVESLGHTRMLKWSAIGAAHWFVMVGFYGLFLTLVEAFGEVFHPEFHLPLIGNWGVWNLFVDLIGLGTVLGIVYLIIRRQQDHPRRTGRNGRFTGSNQGRGYFVEAVVLVIGLCILSIRAAKIASGIDDAPSWSHPVSTALSNLFPDNADLVSVIAFVKIVVSLAWLIVISRTLTMGVAWHRFSAFFNIYFKREAAGAPALGPLQPMTSGGKPIDFEDPDEDAVFGRGKIEDFTWKGMLDFTTCTECGRCQSQCPAWNTGKPLSPKMVVMDLRDHLYAKAPYLVGARTVGDGKGEDAGGESTMQPEQPSAEQTWYSGFSRIQGTNDAQAERPLVGTLEEGGVIDPDVLWSCTSCGACVEQCPVDIEHVDHIMDMRRFQVLIESNFPSEAGVMLRNLENRGNPWGVGGSAREDWMKDLDFPVRKVEGEIDDDVEYLFWVGCAGAIDDRAKKVTKAVAELLHMAGVEFAVLGSGETCSGDPARRMGNEFVFQQLAMENVETLNTVFEGREPGRRKIVATCPHCFNSLNREYPQVGGDYDVVHHTQLLGQLIEEGRLTPVTPIDRKVTYHDPCFLGRHNKVYTPPREILDSVKGLRTQEMHRCKDRGFCCGAGGARMWMEEKIGSRINVNRTEEALELNPDVISTACPFCITMLSDAVTSKQQKGEASEHVEVLDVSQILLRSMAGVGTPGTGSGPGVGTEPDDPAGAGSPLTEH